MEIKENKQFNAELEIVNLMKKMSLLPLPAPLTLAPMTFLSLLPLLFRLDNNNTLRKNAPETGFCPG